MQHPFAGILPAPAVPVLTESEDLEAVVGGMSKGGLTPTTLAFPEEGAQRPLSTMSFREEGTYMPGSQLAFAGTSLGF